MKITPTKGRLLVKQITFESKSPIIIPDAFQDKSIFAEVIANSYSGIHTDEPCDACRFLPGSKIVVGKYSGTDLGNDQLIVLEEDVLAVVS